MKVESIQMHLFSQINLLNNRNGSRSIGAIKSVNVGNKPCPKKDNASPEKQLDSQTMARQTTTATIIILFMDLQKPSLTTVSNIDIQFMTLI